jgi:hypothetical protein
MFGAVPAEHWEITRTYQELSASQFDARAVAYIASMDRARRLYAIHRDSLMVVAAAAFEQDGGPGGSMLITDFTLARPVGPPQRGRLDPRAHLAAILLLERLHDVAANHGRPTELWLERSRGATAVELLDLGFKHTGFSGDNPPYRRSDTAGLESRIERWMERLSGFVGIDRV